MYLSMQQILSIMTHLGILVLLEDICIMWNHRSYLRELSIWRWNITLLLMQLVTFPNVGLLHWCCYRKKKVACTLVIFLCFQAHVRLKCFSFRPCSSLSVQPINFYVVSLPLSFWGSNHSCHCQEAAFNVIHRKMDMVFAI